MTTADLRDLFAYHDWATARLLAVVAGLGADQFTMPAQGGSTSVRDVVAHILAEEWLWLRRGKGENPEAAPAWAEEASRQTLSAAFAEIRSERRAFLTGLADPALDRVVTFRSLEGYVHRHRVGDMLLHIVNRSTYHRGQAAMLLRLVGATPVETDFVVYREST